ncbi:Glucosidase 2 subunit beta [Chionoecetes opilio]|uniref:Glucosidase 2 subunit beta n=1 Tax=Chionoecetes opilio TaxID=41210 RepID=A0A8J4XQF6_CHIOP|nr:Glucosidase 2 subunit beta [Chionoecetes opilio]
MNIGRVLLSLPLRKQTVLGTLVMATVLYIVYQFTFVSELTESSKSQKHYVGEQHKHHRQQAASRRQSHTQEINQKEQPRDVRPRKADETINGKVQVVAEEREKQNSNVKGDINGEWEKKNPQHEIQNVKDTFEKQKSTVTFRCEKSGKLIAVEKLNDNYCDCPEDGSDEPRTNACANGNFVCLKRVKSFPEAIPSGWVNDGVCDCCDGSDEWKMKTNEGSLPLNLQRRIGRYLSPCPDQCPDAT